MDFCQHYNRSPELFFHSKLSYRLESRVSLHYFHFHFLMGLFENDQFIRRLPPRLVMAGSLS